MQLVRKVADVGTEFNHFLPCPYHAIPIMTRWILKEPIQQHGHDRQPLAHVVVEFLRQALSLEFLNGDEASGELFQLLMIPAKHFLVFFELGDIR